MRHSLHALLGSAMIFGATSLHACPEPPEPVVGLGFDSRFAGSDATRSQLNTANAEAAEAALAPLEAFLRALAQQSDDLLEADAADQPALANCMLRQMDVWARADALRDLSSETAQLTIGSRYASLALVARQAGRFGTDRAAMANISAWLQSRLYEQLTFWEDGPSGASRGNLRAWAALAAATTAELADDPVLRGWAGWSSRFVLCTAAPDGSLPQEMSRGRLALHYQLHALAPLTTAATILAPQGVDLTTFCDNALDRAVQFAVSDLFDGRKTRAITGVTQSYFDGSDTLEPWHLAWLEPYIALTGDPALDALAAPMRPLRYSKLGGDQTLMWR